jgi:hypothetical protein
LTKLIDGIEVKFVETLKTPTVWTSSRIIGFEVEKVKFSELLSESSGSEPPIPLKSDLTID